MWEEFLRRLNSIQSEKAPSFVYFVLAPEVGRVKIGVTNAHAKRLAALQTSSPVQLEMLGWVEGDPQREKTYHKRFAEWRVRGEWFEYAPEVAQGIAALLTLEKERQEVEVSIAEARRQLWAAVEAEEARNCVYLPGVARAYSLERLKRLLPTSVLKELAALA